MKEAPFIARRPKEAEPDSFWGLRAQGIAATQDLSGQVWTDYNLHDPGVTILEQVCYALTDLVFRADRPVADHLTGPEGHIDFAGQALHPPEVVFPCRPVTGEDLRRVLLDRLADVEDAACTPGAGQAASGLWRVELRLRDGVGEHADHAKHDARALLRANRNLCEDIDDLWVVREYPCDLFAEIEVAGARDPVDVVADVYYACAGHLAQGSSFVSLDEALAGGLSLEEIFEGPPVRHGLPREASPVQRGDHLFMSELIASLRAIDGVADVNRVALYPEGQDVTNMQSVLRRGPGWALRLRVPSSEGGRAGVVVTRRGSTARLPAGEVHAKYEDLQASRRAQFRGGDHSGFAPAHPRGRHHEATPYSATQEQFPAAYGIGRHGLGLQATPQEKAWAWQLKGYLALFDQVIAHSAAQLAHLRDLYAVDSAPRQTYWWQMLDDESVPGITGKLYTAPAHDIEHGVYGRMDNFYERKGRVLDYLLALHGETYSQNSLRQFGGYYTAHELQAVLHENKAQFARHIIVLGRDRAAAFDDSQPCWKHEDNASGLQQRASLLLGFRHGHERPLAGPVHSLGDGREFGLVSRGPQARGHWHGAQERLQRLPLDRADLELPQAKDDLRRMAAVDGANLDEALLRCAAHPDRYWLDAAIPGRHHLVLGPDENGAYWSLGDHDDAVAARRAAGSVRNLMLRINRESEGMHVVEHLLLRPVGASASHQMAGVDAEFWPQRVTAVFPLWPARSQELNFRKLATETVQLNCPAHVDAHCVWLDFRRMGEFERVYEAWLAARMAWCRGAPDDDKARVRLNHSAAELVKNLRAHHADPDTQGAVR